MKNNRLTQLDVLRGLTVVLMIFFHFSFDLSYFNLIHVDIIHGKFWYFLPRLIVFLFLFVVGFALSLTHSQKIYWDKLKKRQIKLFFSAVLISLSTYFFLPENWIYFGTLHAIFCITFLSLPFLRYPKTGMVLALALFIPSILFDKNIPFLELPIASFDYISIFPWWGASLLGIYIAQKFPQFLNRIPNNSSLQFLGKYSFEIYLLHQPILFPLVFYVKKLALMI